MKRLKIISYLLVLQVLLVITALQIEGKTPVSSTVETDDTKKNSPIEPIIKKVREYQKAKKFKEALQELNKARDKFPQKEYLEKLQINRADIHVEWALSLYKQYDYDKAIKHFEMAYAINKFYRLKNAAKDLTFIGYLYNALGQKNKALEHYEKALPVSQAVGDRGGEAMILNNIGTVYSDLGHKHKALEYYEKALPIRKEVGNLAGEASTLSNIGGVYSDLGQIHKALEYVENALVIYREVGDRGGEALTLNNIGFLHMALDQNHKALAYYEKALPIQRMVKDRIGEAVTLANIGLVYSAFGQKYKALEYCEKALPIHREVGDRVGEADTLNNIGGVYSALGQLHKALEYYKKALPVRRAVGDRAGVATTLNNIGGVYFDLGQKHKALEYYEKLLLIRRAVGDRAGEALTLNNIGGVYFDLGQKHKALKYYEEALPIRKAIRDRSGEAITLNNLMITWKNLKNKKIAIYYGKQSVNAYQNLRANISKMKRESKKSYLEETKNTYRFLTRLLINEGRISEAQNILDMLKEKEYLEFTHRNPSSTILIYNRMDFTEFEQQWLDRYKKVTDNSTSISGDYYLLNKKKVKNDEEKKRLKELEDSLEKFRKDYDQYLAESKEAFDKYNKTPDKGSIKTPMTQKRLRERQAILRRLDEKESGKSVFLNFLVEDERLVVIFTTPNSQFVKFCNVSKAKLNRLILEYRTTIETRSKVPQIGMNNDSQLKTIYGKLYDAIFKPVDIELEKYGATNLMVYLDGLLRYISLPVLWDGENYLVQRYRISRFTSASFDRIKREPEAINNILGLGASRGGEGFEPLPNVKDEIHGIVSDKGKGFDGIIKGKAFLDNDFTRDTFVNQLKTASYPLVHISSHFSFNSGGETADETRSHLLMGDGTKMNLKEIREHKGLFKGVELLMLSACETGMGDADGQEIDGFGELAQQSGAQAVVASLWKVKDESTKDLMINFYRILKQGNVTSKIEALRQAQLQLAGLDDLLNKSNPTAKRKRTKYAHPYYWGPFIMIGNWR